MQTSLKGIADKAGRDKNYRFANLYRCINENFLLYCWGKLNKKAAAGVDGVSYEDYEINLRANIEDLVGRLKAKKYRAKLVRRKFIPKGNGKTRPLGIPAIEDKLLQYAVSLILQAIYEQDFLPCSYGYRPKRGAHDAVKDLKQTLQNGKYHYVVEADIKGFFDNLQHEWLVKMLELRINDKSFIGLIKKWLKAGILDINKMIIHPLTGSPQGGVVSPVLANIYMHYVLNLWFEKVVKRHCKGLSHLCVYADDFVCAFQYEYDAKRFYDVLGKRLNKFGLNLSPEKTNIITFRRWVNSSFDFLGFEFRMGTSRIRTVKLRTSRKKLRKSLETFTQWCKDKRNLRVNILFKKLNRKLRGYYNYYGVRGNFKSLGEFNYLIRGILFKWLNRRSQKKSYNWEGYKVLLYDMKLIKPRIVKSF